LVLAEGGVLTGCRCAGAEGLCYVETAHMDGEKPQGQSL
jgi:hypothetical protein